MSTHSLVVAGRSFVNVLYHDSMIEEIHHEGNKGSDKRHKFQGRFSRAIVVLEQKIVVLKVGIIYIYTFHP